ncbi:unnamed protein product [Withania somnifera]
MASLTTCFLHILTFLFICLPRANTIDFSYPAVFSFGDSKSDTGGLVAGVGDRLEPPNGKTYFKNPSGRFCDGRLMIDFLSMLPTSKCPFTPLGVMVFISRFIYILFFMDFCCSGCNGPSILAAPSFRKGANFAAVGSTILPATASSVSPFSFGIQVAQFFRFKNRVSEIQAKTRKYDKYIPAQDFFQKGLYTFDIGQNDLAGGFYSKTLDQILASIPSILSEFEDGVKRLYDLGARNFWVHNTGPLGCLGQNIAKFGTDASKLDELGCVSSHNQAAKFLNLQLYALCKKLQGQYSEANISHTLIFSPSRFEQPLMACCGYGGPPLNYDSRIACGKTKVLDGNNVTAKACNDSNEYINWDGIHHTETANQFVASQILTGKYSDAPFADRMPFLLKLKF